MSTQRAPLLDRLWHQQPPSRKVVYGGLFVLVVFGLLHPLVADGEGAEAVTGSVTLQTELHLPDTARTALVTCFAQQRPDTNDVPLAAGETLGARIEIRKGKTRLVTFTTVPQGAAWATPCLERELASVAWPGARKADGTVTFAAEETSD